MDEYLYTSKAGPTKQENRGTVHIRSSRRKASMGTHKEKIESHPLASSTVPKQKIPHINSIPTSK